MICTVIRLSLLASFLLPLLLHGQDAEHKRLPGAAESNGDRWVLLNDTNKLLLVDGIGAGVAMGLFFAIQHFEAQPDKLAVVRTLEETEGETKPIGMKAGEIVKRIDTVYVNRQLRRIIPVVMVFYLIAQQIRGLSNNDFNQKLSAWSNLQW